MKIRTVLPGKTLPDAYFNVRYRTLRQPLGSPLGSERLPADDRAIHAYAEIDDTIVGVGRVHLLEGDEDGSALDAAAQSTCPAFPPLQDDEHVHVDDSGMELPTDLRPAVQVRAMGTLDEHQEKGVASAILKALETESRTLWNAQTGWLQARLSAIPFYEANGWCCFGDEYEVPNVGPHVSMWKPLTPTK